MSDDLARVLAEWVRRNDEHQNDVLDAIYAKRMAEAVLASGVVVSADKVRAGEASDGYHTHRELYEYRMLYNAHAARGWLAAGIPVVKSWRHSDGEPCFGGGWFIVTATLPTGQVSNHYEAMFWPMFDVPEVDLPPEYDGHTPQIAADRLRSLLSEPATDAAPMWNCPHGCGFRPGVDCYDCGDDDDAPTGEAQTGHVCEECPDCIHNGNKCCGCYDGFCCRTTVSLPEGGEQR